PRLLRRGVEHERRTVAEALAAERAAHGDLVGVGLEAVRLQRHARPIAVRGRAHRSAERVARARGETGGEKGDTTQRGESDPHVRTGLRGGAAPCTARPRKCWRTVSARSVTQRDGSPVRSGATGKRSGRGRSSFQRARWSAREARTARARASGASTGPPAGRTPLRAVSVSKRSVSSPQGYPAF